MHSLKDIIHSSSHGIVIFLEDTSVHDVQSHE